MEKIKKVSFWIFWIVFIGFSLLSVRHLQGLKIVNPAFDVKKMSPAQIELYRLTLLQEIPKPKSVAEKRPPYDQSYNKPITDWNNHWLEVSPPISPVFDNRYQLGELGDTPVLTSIFQSKEMIIKDFNWVVEILPMILAGSLLIGTSLTTYCRSRHSRIVCLAFGLSTGFAWGFDVSFAYGLVLGLGISQIWIHSMKHIIPYTIGVAIGMLVSFLSVTNLGFVFNFNFGFKLAVAFGLCFGLVYYMYKQTRNIYKEARNTWVICFVPPPDEFNYIP
ncbi:hypothetical protein H6784_05330 [Candidatus Nomurabacteria bacterium]|nr:hypothetical protein [Candidatus Nomurabacteria bacterium]